MTTVQRRHRYARLYLCKNCIELAKKYNEVMPLPADNVKIGICEVCRETKKLQEVFTTAFDFGI